VFRRLNPDTELGRVFFEYSSRGELVPDELTVRLWAESLHAHEVLGDFKPRTDLLILDGIPRSVDQARLMEQHIDVLAVIQLVCDDKEEMIMRLRRRALKENRIDDADEKVIRHRWKVYEKETRPVLDYYDPGRIREVGSVASPAEVLRNVLDHLVPIQNAHFASFEG
jgi:adenylate kinase